MRNQFICAVPEALRDQIGRQAAEEIDRRFAELDDSGGDEHDDVDALWGIRQLLN